MFDIPTPATADFNLRQTLPPNLDQNLYVQAAARLQRCHRQWRELIAQRPATAGKDWWETRAPYTAVSRREKALGLYRQHFEATCHIACAEGTLTRTHVQTLATMVEPEGTASSGLQVSRLTSSADTHPWPGALKIRLASDQSFVYVLYLPSRLQGMKLFAQPADLERWLLAQQPDTPSSAVALSEIALGNDPLRENLSALLSHASSLADTWLADSAPLSAESTATDSPVLLGLLNPDIALSQRSAALASQHAALDRLLGENPETPSGANPASTLQQQFDALTHAEQASHAAASALFDSAPPLQVPALRHSKNPHYHALHKARLDGLRAEADLQRSLDQLSLEDHRRLIALLDAVEPTSRPPDVLVARITLTSTADNVARSEELNGVLVLAWPQEGQADPARNLLLYWPGRFGGLQTFASRQALELDVFKRAPDDRDAVIHLTPLKGDPFTWALQQQLYACEQQAIQIIRDHPLPTERAAALHALRTQQLMLLTVPLPASRDLAYAQHLEQNQSAALAERLPPWFSQMGAAPRGRLKDLLNRYIHAMHEAQTLLERELTPREDFSQQRIDARLRQDFALMHRATITLDLPDSTSWQKVVMEGAAPGTPQRNTLVPGATRSTLTLAQLAQGNIDQSLWWRLTFLRVTVSSDDAQERQTLTAGLTPAYLRSLVTDLDLAGQYETLIRQTFLGSPSALAFHTAWRRETLTEPWRLTLKLHGEFARQQGQIDARGQRILDIATDAASRAAYDVEGHNIVLLPAHLTVGGKDTDGQGATTLGGVTFIVDRISGQTLLYLPDNPQEDGLRQFDSQEDARLNLFNRCVKKTMVEYLAGRAVTGDFASHVSRINEAQRRNFNAVIGIGVPWPATTSLSAHLLNVHMGRLLQAHRDSSRSNDALYLEHCALHSGAVFNYLKMALGLLPFVGSAIALYDAWESANLSVAAFLRGDVGQGLAALESVLLSLVDAAMDVLPSAAVGPGTIRSKVRALTRQRHRAAVGTIPTALRRASRREARLTLDHFKGYEYEQPIFLADLHPAEHGVYRQVYRHADGDFIISQGRIYQVQLSDTHRGWRLAGTRQRGYKMPIALDEAGNWNSHYAVHGTLMNGGGAGGGAALTHVADGMDPLWPEAIRRWLPRWWTDRHLRRQLTLTHTAEACFRRLDSQTRTTNASMERYYTALKNERHPHREPLDKACVNDIECADDTYRNLAELLPLSHGRKRTQIEDMQDRSAWVATDRYLHRIQFSKDRMIEYLDVIEKLLNRSDATPASNTRAHLDLMKLRKLTRVAFLKEFEQAHAFVEQVNHWHRRMTSRDHKARIAVDVAAVNSTLSATNYRYLKAAHLLEMITHPDAIEDASWMYFHVQLKQARNEVGRALFTQHNLTEVRASHAQRQRVLEDSLALYGTFRRNLNAWSLGYPQHLDFEHLTPFLDSLAKVEAHARTALDARTSTANTAPTPGKKLFETEDNRLLVGVEQTDPATRQKRFTIEGVDGHTETWLPRSSGKYHLGETVTSVPSVPDQPLQPLLNEARKRLASLADYQSKVDGYARQDMLPVDLEHMMVNEANELATRAQTIQRLSAQEPLIGQLTEQSAQLKRVGRQLRIEHSINSQTPSEGYLDYLLEQKAVALHKLDGLQDLGKRPNGTRDFLQEYEIRDLTRQPSPVLWYAHFHYNSAKAPLNDFVKAHLKLPSQRNLGLQWQQAQARSGVEVESIWRGDIGKVYALKHFAML